MLYYFTRPKAEPEEQEDKEEEVVEGLYCTIKPGEVPPVPQNRFLQRNVEPRQMEVDKNEENNKRKERDESGENEGRDSTRRMRETNDKENERRRNFLDYRPPHRTRDAAGRKVKGRGALVGLFLSELVWFF